MGGDCEGVKGATADIRLFPLPPLSRPQTQNPLHNIDCMK